MMRRRENHDQRRRGEDAVRTACSRMMAEDALPTITLPAWYRIIDTHGLDGLNEINHG